MPENTEYWDLDIKPTGSLFQINIREIIEYKDLMLLIVKRDFTASYKQTVFGPLWIFIQPLLTTITFTFIFGHLAGLSTNGLPKPLFYMSGITAWNYFTDCLNKNSNVFRANSGIFGKVYFPRLIIPLSTIISNLVRFCIQLSMFFVLMAYYGWTGADFHMTWYILFVPLLIIMMALLGLGIGLVISSMTTRYRDLNYLVSFGVQLMMYASPIIYPLSFFPQKYRWIIKLNPMAPIIETFKLGFLGAGTFSWYSLAYSIFFTIGISVFGIIVFNKVQRNFIDII